jgi:hypothetical protein
LGNNKNAAQPICDLASDEKQGGNNRNNQNNRRSIVRQALPNNAIPQNEWHHMAWIWDREGQTLSTLLDGDNLGDAKKPSGGNWSRSLDLAVNSHTMRIGSQEAKQGNAVPTFNGGLDELWIFDKALSRAQLRNLIKFNDIQGEAAVATVAPASGNGSVTPSPAPTLTPAPTVSSTPSAPITPRSAVVESTPIPPRPADDHTLASNSGTHASPGRLVGIVACLAIIVTLSCYLIWAVMERGKVRATA